MEGHSCLVTRPQLFLAVIANTLLQVRSVFLLPQRGQGTEPAGALEIGRLISKDLRHFWHLNS